MKKILILLLLIVTLVISNKLMAQSTPIKINDHIPNFTLKDQNGDDFAIENIIGENNIVIYFYPKDDTPGCTKEACKFRDEFENFTDLNTVVIGISSDSVESHKKFIKKYNLPFTLLADTDKKVRKLFGVKNVMGFVPGRVTYVINKEGKVVYIFNSMNNAEQHVNEALKFLK